MTDIMPRKQRTFRIDERLLEFIDQVAKGSKISASLALEEMLFSIAKLSGKLSKDAQPLGELRGGKPQDLDKGEFIYRSILHKVMQIKGDLQIERWNKESQTWEKPKRSKQLLAKAAQVIANSS